MQYTVGIYKKTFSDCNYLCLIVITCTTGQKRQWNIITCHGLERNSSLAMATMRPVMLWNNISTINPCLLVKQVTFNNLLHPQLRVIKHVVHILVIWFYFKMCFPDCFGVKFERWSLFACLLFEVSIYDSSLPHQMHHKFAFITDKTLGNAIWFCSN